MSQRELPHALAQDQAELAVLREMARDMDIALYRRYDEAAAAKIVGLPTKEFAEIREKGHISYLHLDGRVVGYFGIQILQYLLDCIVVRDSQLETANPSDGRQSAATGSTNAEYLSVAEASVLTGISRSKLYQFLASGEIGRVKVGRRTLIKREAILAFMNEKR